MLRDDARIWWERSRLTVNLATLTLEEFKTVFFAKYFTIDARYCLTREFLTLKQRSMTILEYVHKFERGCYIASLIGEKLEEKIKQFF